MERPCICFLISDILDFLEYTLTSPVGPQEIQAMFHTVHIYNHHHQQPYHWM